MKVGFMVAGVQKGGTTAMYEYLRSHPEIAMGRRKEPHFFDKDSRDWSAPDYRSYHKLYERDRPATGDCTPLTVFWNAAHERIRAYNADMRFILLFHDPVERAYSHWCMQYACGRETLPFDAAIRDGRARTARKLRRFSYVERGFYAAQIAAMRLVFPAAPMLFLLSEELQEDHAAVLARVAGFLGVDPAGFRAGPLRARTREPVAYPSRLTPADRAFLRELYAPDLDRFATMTGLDIGRWPSASDAAGG